MAINNDKNEVNMILWSFGVDGTLGGGFINAFVFNIKNKGLDFSNWYPRAVHKIKKVCIGCINLLAQQPSVVKNWK